MGTVPKSTKADIKFFLGLSLQRIGIAIMVGFVSFSICQEMYNVPLVKTQMKKIIVTAKTLYSHPKNVSKIYAALHTDLAW